MPNAIPSQAQSFGIERPKVRNRHAVAHLNTLTSVVVNLKALRTAKEINANLLNNEEKEGLAGLLLIPASLRQEN